MGGLRGAAESEDACERQGQGGGVVREGVCPQRGGIRGDLSEAPWCQHRASLPRRPAPAD